MPEKARQHLEEQLRRLEQQREDTKRKLRALARHTQREQRYRCGECVELAWLAHLDSGTLLGGLCEVATGLADRERAAQWKAVGDARLAEQRRRRAHRTRSTAPPVGGSALHAQGGSAQT